MQIIWDGKYGVKRSVVALGMFDGVHIGHRVLLERGCVLARRAGVPLVVCTFMEHPLAVIAPDKCPPMLSTFDERVKLMEALGVDVLYAIPFDERVRDMLPEEYVGELVRRFHPTDVVCGYNHTFGRRGQGTPALLAALGNALGFRVSVVPKITLQGAEVSSTAVRGLLAQGDVAQAARLLGRPYQLEAAVTAQEGARLTLALPRKQLPPPGQYRALCEVDGHTWPVTLCLKKEREAAVRLPRGEAAGQQVILRLLAGRRAANGR